MTYRSIRFIRKAAISVAIQTALEEMGISFFDVRNKLQQDYGCSTFEVIDNPDYLKKVIRDSYGDKYEEIIKAIQKNLSEDSSHTSIECFIESLNK